MELEERIVTAAGTALAAQQYVSAIDILTGIGWLAASHVATWRKGLIDTIEGTMQVNPVKISQALQIFREWALEKGLKPCETAYLRTTRTGLRDLQFTVSGDPDTEQFFRTHFVSSELPERKQRKITEKLGSAPKPVVFEILRDSKCSECGVDLPRGSFLLMEGGQPLCLACAHLDDLEYLPAGDTALTRRSTRYSPRSAVVVRFSRSRGRYERQGILVEPSALGKAEQECSEDAEERAKARAAGAVRRKKEDRELIAQMTAEIARLFPGCPPKEVAAIAAHTATRGSGRVGRTAAGRGFKEGALTAAVTAAVRHNYTNYDDLLASEVDRELARERVIDRVREILEDWKE